MKIEKRGIPPNEQKYRVLCQPCQSTLIITKNDAVAVRGFGKLVFVCPVCNHRFIVDGVYR